MAAMRMASCVLLLVAALLASFPARAAALPHPDRVVTLSVVDQDLGEVLSEVGSQAGFRVNVSPAVHGRVHGRLPAAPAAAVLDHLAAMFGFQWYYDGETVYVSAYNEATSKLLVLAGVGADRLWRTMEELGIADPRWPIHAAEDSDLGMARGPPRYIALIDQTLTALAPKAAATPDVHVFRGTAASF